MIDRDKKIMEVKVIDLGTHKICRSKLYNYEFDKRTGFTKTWGKTVDDDPIMAPANTILDIEISTVCNKSCSFCYKGNSPNGGENMSLDTYKDIINKFPNQNGVFFLQQVALGIGSVEGNPDLFDILEYTRSTGIIPNLTINGKDISDEHIEKLASLTGSIAVSHYNDNDCFETIHRLAEAKRVDKATLKQINIHKMLSEETYESCTQLLHKISKNELLKNNLNAVVFLSNKPKGPHNNYTTIKDLEKTKKLFNLAQEKDIRFGCDSCSAPMVLKWIEETEQDDITQSIESCESCLSSFYISVKGFAYPCSFSEGHKKWVKGIDMLSINNFAKDVWFSERIEQWRKTLIKSSSECDCSMKKECRACPIYDITPCLQGKPDSLLKIIS